MAADPLAETIERLIAIEPRVNGVARGAFGDLYRVARRQQGVPLAARAAGAVDGVTRLRRPTVDGLPLPVLRSMVTLLRATL